MQCELAQSAEIFALAINLLIKRKTLGLGWPLHMDEETSMTLTMLAEMHEFLDQLNADPEFV